MPVKSASDRYGSVAIAIHWLTAILILVMFILGFSAEEAETDALERMLLIPHIVIGITILLLTLFRIGWWVFADKKPAEQPGIPTWQARLATLVHILAYVFIIGLAVSGIATNIVSGMIPALASGTPLPSLEDVAPFEVHETLAKLFIGLLVVHIGAALYHHFIRRDGLLARMGIGAVRR